MWAQEVAMRASRGENSEAATQAESPIWDDEKEKTNDGPHLSLGDPSFTVLYQTKNGLILSLFNQTETEVVPSRDRTIPPHLNS
jgi:hypothetical protein